MSKRITALWERGLPQTRERLDHLENTAKALAAGICEGDMVPEAAGIAHKLAGSLGMFGFAEGTRVARELETELEKEEPQAARLTELVQELRGAILPAAE